MSRCRFHNLTIKFASKCAPPPVAGQGGAEFNDARRSTNGDNNKELQKRLVILKDR